MLKFWTNLRTSMAMEAWAKTFRTDCFSLHTTQIHLLLLFFCCFTCFNMQVSSNTHTHIHKQTHLHMPQLISNAYMLLVNFIHLCPTIERERERDLQSGALKALKSDEGRRHFCSVCVWCVCVRGVFELNFLQIAPAIS